MKIDVKIKLFNRTEPNPLRTYLRDNGLIKNDDILAVTIDMDYINGYDDVIDAIDFEIYKKYGIQAHFEVNYTIDSTEASRICDILDI